MCADSGCPRERGNGPHFELDMHFQSFGKDCGVSVTCVGG